MDDRQVLLDMGLVEGEDFNDETFAEMDDNKGKDDE